MKKFFIIIGVIFLFGLSAVSFAQDNSALCEKLFETRNSIYDIEYMLEEKESVNEIAQSALDGFISNLNAIALLNEGSADALTEGINNLNDKYRKNLTEDFIRELGSISLMLEDTFFERNCE